MALSFRATFADRVDFVAVELRGMDLCAMADDPYKGGIIKSPEIARLHALFLQCKISDSLYPPSVLGTTYQGLEIANTRRHSRKVPWFISVFFNGPRQRSRSTFLHRVDDMTINLAEIPANKLITVAQGIKL